MDKRLNWSTDIIAMQERQRLRERSRWRCMLTTWRRRPMPMPRPRCRQLCRRTLWLPRPKHTLMRRSGPASTCSAFTHILSCTAVQIEHSRGSVQICSSDWLLEQACSMHSPGMCNDYIHGHEETHMHTWLCDRHVYKTHTHAHDTNTHTGTMSLTALITMATAHQLSDLTDMCDGRYTVYLLIATSRMYRV